MPQSTRTWRTLALFGAGSLALAACGGGSGSGSPGTAAS